MLLTLLQSVTTPVPPVVVPTKVGGDDVPRIEIWETRQARRKAREVRRSIEVLREELPQEVEVGALPPIPIRVDSPDWSAYLRQLSDIEQQLRIVRERLAEQDDEEVLLLL